MIYKEAFNKINYKPFLKLFLSIFILFAQYYNKKFIPINRIRKPNILIYFIIILIRLYSYFKYY
jgi:hypothetical protein